MGNSLKGKQAISITRLQKGWTRHGGANKAYHIKEEKEEWICQACGVKQPSQLVAYLFPFLESEIVRICSICQNIVNSLKIDDFHDLRKIVR